MPLVSGYNGMPTNPRGITACVYMRGSTVPNKSRLLFINCYFPVDKPDFDEFEVVGCLNDVLWLLENSDFDEVILRGDLNTDFSRNTRFVNLVSQKLQEFRLTKIWDSYPVDFTYMHTQRTADGQLRTNLSIVDHFCMSPNLLCNIEQALSLIHI